MSDLLRQHSVDDCGVRCAWLLCDLRHLRTTGLTGPRARSRARAFRSEAAFGGTSRDFAAFDSFDWPEV